MFIFATMKVNFNNLRKQALYSYHRLATKLNEAKEERKEEGYDDGKICIYPDDIQDEMDDLRSMLFGIACVYDEGNDEFKDISEEIKPIAVFNSEEEEEEESDDNDEEN